MSKRYRNSVNTQTSNDTSQNYDTDWSQFDFGQSDDNWDDDPEPLHSKQASGPFGRDEDWNIRGLKPQRRRRRKSWDRNKRTVFIDHSSSFGDSEDFGGGGRGRGGKRNGRQARH